MKFKIEESSHSEIEGIIEGSNLEDILDMIGGKCGIKSKKLKATYELKENRTMICVVRAGRRITVKMVPLNGDEETSANQ